jgi:helicase SWR1
MSKMLDVIEAFANLCGFTYVRLDGGTKVTERQLVVDRFNRDKKIFLFISSTRAGGVGINLTGADTVVFFDSDWNPAMDRQAMDRCHRIGQMRDVHIYRLVSEKTIEENIFVKQLQKRQLDHVVIDQATGGEAPKFVQSTGLEDLLDGVIMDEQLTEPSQRSSIYGTHILWERPGDEVAVETKTKADLEMERMLAKVEDVEDVSALKTAMKEREVVALNEQAVDVEQTEGNLPVEALHANNEDPQYLQLPGIVRRSVDLVESLLVEERNNSTPELENDEEEWEELDQAQWASDDEESYSD